MPRRLAGNTRTLKVERARKGPFFTIGDIRSIVERMLFEDGFIALWAGRHDRNGHFAQLLKTIQIGLSFGRQVFPALDAEGCAAPARHRFVDRHATGDFIGTDGQQIYRLAVQLVASADAQFLEAIKNVKLGDAKPCQAIDTTRATQCCRIEPAVTVPNSRPTCDI